MVVKEMEYLFLKKDCRIFLFEDDDFPVKAIHGSEWINLFCNTLKKRGLDNKILWKVNCRPDEIEEERFLMMKKNGLYLVFIGIDDGTNEGLVMLNKHNTVEESLNGINILRKLELGFDYGFMLFQPLTHFRSLNENLDFLRLLCGDGYTPVIFNKLMPYYETRIERGLSKEGRIKGPPGHLNYDFLDESMNHYYDFITDCFMEWLRYPDGLVNISKWARNYLLVYSHFFESTREIPLIKRTVTKIISESNLFLLDTMNELSAMFESEKYNSLNINDLKGFRENINLKHILYKEQIKNSMAKLLRLVEHQRKPQSVFG
jgi:anaerobic magnesium-protoporphyrin IX monomethyl ester cyclase